MRFLKVLFWLCCGGLVAAFVIYNRRRARQHPALWGGLIADFSLPLLLILVFLARACCPSLLAYQRPALADAPAARRAGARARRSARRCSRRPRLAGARAGRSRLPLPETAMRSPIYVALDTPDLERAKAIAAAGPQPCRRDQARPRILHAPTAATACTRWREIGLPIFLDLKFHDIPNTVAKAVQALRPLEPAILTVHAARRPGDARGRQGRRADAAPRWSR